MQQKRYRGKINIQKPRAPHHERGKLEKFTTPFISNPSTHKPWRERCSKITVQKSTTKLVNPYEVIIAKECLNWFNNSKMVALFHNNSIKSQDQFKFAVPLRKANMYFKGYQPPILRIALTNSIYEPILQLVQKNLPVTYFVFSPETNVEKLVKIAKKTPQLALIGNK